MHVIWGLGMVAHTWNYDALEAKAGRLMKFWHHPRKQREFQENLNYIMKLSKFKKPCVTNEYSWINVIWTEKRKIKSLNKVKHNFNK